MIGVLTILYSLKIMTYINCVKFVLVKNLQDNMIRMFSVYRSINDKCYDLCLFVNCFVSMFLA